MRLGVVGLTGAIIFLLILVIHFSMNASPSPSISADPHNARPTAWNGYSPLARMFKPQEPGGTGTLSMYAFVRWLVNVFSLSDQRPSTISETPPSLPHSYKTDIVAGISVAHHNPFSSHQLAGVALLFHACRQSAPDWFILPEHRRLTAELLRLNLAILAVSSSNRVTGCWSTHHPASHNYDAARVRLVIRQWSIVQGIAHDAPFYGVGVSSGATFLTVLAAANSVPSLVSQALYFSAGNPRAIRNASRTFPNTIFIRLTSDRYYAPASIVASSRMTLLSKQVALVAELPLGIDPWTPLSFHEHEPLLSKEDSESIYAHLPECNHNIECSVKAAAQQNASISRLWNETNLRRSIIQVDRVLKGRHELSASHASQVANWLVQNGREMTNSSLER